MRTTVSLDPDFGLTASTMPRHRFSQRAAEIGLRVDVTNIADVLESLDARP